MTLLGTAPEPLARQDDVPIVYSSLGATFHLELLDPQDEAALENVTGQIHEWFGAELHWTALSCYEWVTPFRIADLEYIACYVRDLDAPELGSGDARILAADFEKVGRMDYEVNCKGGYDTDDASPFLLRFCTEIPELIQSPRYQAYSVLKLCVPDSWSVADFYSRVMGIASRLRLRWATAGLTYAVWECQDWAQSRAAIYSHARRHPGYDVGFFHSDMQAWYDQVRSVSWLTLLGPDLASRIQPKVRPSSLVDVSRVGQNLCIRAGEAPAAGDINRLIIPKAYVEADHLIRPIRAFDGERFMFLGKWEKQTITEWLKRFECG